MPGFRKDDAGGARRILPASMVGAGVSTPMPNEASPISSPDPNSGLGPASSTPIGPAVTPAVDAESPQARQLRQKRESPGEATGDFEPKQHGLPCRAAWFCRRRCWRWCCVICEHHLVDGGSPPSLYRCLPVREVEQDPCRLPADLCENHGEILP